MTKRIIKILVAMLVAIPVMISHPSNENATTAGSLGIIEETTSSVVTTEKIVETPISTTTPETTVPTTTTTEISTTTEATTTTTTTVTTTVVPEVTEITTEVIAEEVNKQYYDIDRFSERLSNDNWLFVGDSRFCFWQIWGLPGNYIAESGQGLNMIYDNYDEIVSYRDYNVVFNLGANQWWNGEEYVNLLNSFPEEFIENNHIIVMSVNPTDGNYAYLNEKFDNYNSIVRDNLRDEYEYFDMSSYMKDNGFSTADGLHYTTNQDYIMYDFFMNG